jgi:acyl-CoA thioesterase-1
MSVSFAVRSWVCCAAAVLVALVAPVAPTAAEPPAILVVGDSLSAAYGIAANEGWVALLERRLREQGYDQRVINASVSGETSRGASARLPQLLTKHEPGIVVIEIGGNDGLRGLPITELRANLTRMIEGAQEAGASVLLVGMRIPPNYGPRYAEEFHGSFVELADEYDTALVPFFLEGVALDDTLMQDDGIHPRAAAQPLLLDRVWARLEPLLKDARGAAMRGAAPDAAPASD